MCISVFFEFESIIFGIFILHTEIHQLMELRDRNDKISGHLNRNRSRDFTLKQEQIEVRIKAATNIQLNLDIC